MRKKDKKRDKIFVSLPEKSTLRSIKQFVKEDFGESGTPLYAGLRARSELYRETFLSRPLFILVEGRNNYRTFLSGLDTIHGSSFVLEET